MMCVGPAFCTTPGGQCCLLALDPDLGALVCPLSCSAQLGQQILHKTLNTKKYYIYVENKLHSFESQKYIELTFEQYINQSDESL